MKLHNLAIAAVGLVLFSSYLASAQEPGPTPVPMTVKGAWLYPDPAKNVAGIGDQIVVEVDSLLAATEKGQINPRDLVLYLNGQVLKGLTAEPIDDQSQNHLKFELKRTTDSSPGWRRLLGSPSLTSNLREVIVSVGFPEKQALPLSNPSHPPIIYLRIYYGWWAAGAFIILFVVIVLFIWLAKRGYLIHDSNPPQPPPGQLKPYSLALTQAAWWFFLVIGSFLLIYMITGDYNTITDQALILMGIGTGTALGAAMVDATKRDTSNAQLNGLRPQQAKLAAEVDELLAKQADLQNKLATPGAAPTPEDKQALADTNVALKEKQAELKQTNEQIDEAEAPLSKPVSESFGRDLLTDADGITLHRFQMVIWTIVIGALFCMGVYKELAMPEFSGTLLALMGISNGTYLGFKIPEKQT